MPEKSELQGHLARAKMLRAMLFAGLTRQARGGSNLAAELDFLYMVPTRLNTHSPMMALFWEAEEPIGHGT